MKLVSPDSPYLRKIQLHNPDINHLRVGLEMFDLMLENKGIGLAANQVGVDAKMFVTTQMPDRIIIDPKWRKCSGEEALMIEGCLSFPGWIAPVKRYVDITAWWTDIKGNRKGNILTGLAAHVFQHETDHLRGVLMIDRLTPEQKQTLRNFYGDKIYEARRYF